MLPCARRGCRSIGQRSGFLFVCRRESRCSIERQSMHACMQPCAHRKQALQKTWLHEVTTGSLHISRQIGHSSSCGRASRETRAELWKKARSESDSASRAGIDLTSGCLMSLLPKEERAPFRPIAIVTGRDRSSVCLTNLASELIALRNAHSLANPRTNAVEARSRSRRAPCPRLHAAPSLSLSPMLPNHHLGISLPRMNRDTRK